MFLPTPPNPPRGMTCKVLSPNNSSYNLLDRRHQATDTFPDALLSVQVSSQIELPRPDGGEVHMVCAKVLLREARYVLRSYGLDAGGDLFWCQELRACYDATPDAIHPRRGALQGEERRALELLLGARHFLFLHLLIHDPPELLDDHPDRLLHVARGGADVSLDSACVRVSLVVGVHGVCETPLLPNLLKEPAAH